MVTIRAARAEDAPRALAIWRGAVLATHDFLSPDHFVEIERMVAERYLPVAPLWLAVDARDAALGFMGLSAGHVDSLFVDPERRGGGIGRGLIDHARSLHGGLTVDVNEQNAGAVGFYERLGFVRTGRSPLDDDGRPYPLLHMALSGG
jgi:putative acetyltransferase